MNHLMDKRILLGVSGSIAAYKAAELVRQLRAAQAQVRVVMTANAERFVGALTFQALSGHAVRGVLFDAGAEQAMGHIELARWADAIVIAPATADCCARLAHGRADDLLTSVCLAAEVPLCVAPAMNQAMWRNAATRDNVERLRARGIHLWGPGHGDQACGEYGDGRMLEAAELVQALGRVFHSDLLSGTRILITAGPTREPVDAVRYLSNRSSGKMGFALARAAQEAGARVTLVSGPVALTTPDRVQRHEVVTARQMRDAVLERLGHCDIFIGAAAVSDYSPADPAVGKIKKQGVPPPALRVEPTPDILREVSAARHRPFTVGFAAETEQLVEHARQKLQSKRLDMIAANQVGDAQGFEVDDNALEVLWPQGHISLPFTHKDKLARSLIALIAERYHAEHRAQDS